MKSRWLILTLLLMGNVLAAFGQIAFELEKMNVLYLHLPNPMNIVVQGMPRKDIQVSCMHHCSVVDADSVYYVSPALIGDCYVVLQNKNGDTIAKETFRALPIPPPTTSLGALGSGGHDANIISQQNRIEVDFASGFAYEGMTIRMDSCRIRLTTPFEIIECHQLGPVLHPLIASRIPDVSEIIVYDIHSTIPGTRYRRELSPIIIREQGHPEYISLKMPIEDAPRTQRVNECRIMDNTLEDYVMDGKHHRISNSKNKKHPINDFVHLLDKDTLIAIQNSYYRHFTESGNILEAGPIAAIPDTIAHREVEGEIDVKADYMVFENDSAFILRLPRRFYPVGEWKYYYPNGQVKAAGNYVIDGVSLDKKEGINDSANHYQLEIRRDGIWYFCNEKGKLIREVNYSK